MLKGLLKRLMFGDHLDREEMAEAIGSVMDGDESPAAIAAFLVALRLKGETVDEISGAAEAMRSRMTKVAVPDRELLDTCGTGGDGASTINISTAAAFVAASGGVAVAKHGNRAVSSRSGSADVLTELGVDITIDAEAMSRCIEEVGIGFLFAPTLHPAMKHAAPIRKELGIRTVFNVLGPLTNPAGAVYQVLGVFDAKLTDPLARVLGSLGSKKAWVVHGEDGLDELTVCDKSQVAIWDGASVSTLTVHPTDVGLEEHAPEGIRGGTPRENAGFMREILGGKREGAMRDAVALNAGAGLHVAGKAEDLKTGVEQALSLMAEGKPLAVLDRLIAATLNGG